jgi:hypothetical protein|tara:strand:- start:1031 stop:1486 length:456 start_codon:yes stop_codon:yes gene_type:complete
MKLLIISKKTIDQPFPVKIETLGEKEVNQWGRDEYPYNVIYRGEPRRLPASHALHSKLSMFPVGSDVVIKMVKFGDGVTWDVSKSNDKSFTEEYKTPDWDKIAEGKVRHGFAIEAYKLGYNLDQSTAEKIDAWVHYVMVGEVQQVTEEIPF